MAEINYRHLRYFYEVAREGHLGRTAERLNVSQSALSIQIRTLEDRIGHQLFDRTGRQLEPTEVGRIAFEYAARIFAAGAELQATLAQAGDPDAPLRVGALSTLSRNFQLSFLKPILAEGRNVTLRSGDIEKLLSALDDLSLDIVLSTELPPSDFDAHPIATQHVGLHAVPDRLGHRTLQELLSSEPLILPTDRAIRPLFDGLLARLDVTPSIAAEVDDMAMIRLLARENAGVAVAPAVVFADEIASGRLATAPFPLDISEPFYAVTKKRDIPHPGLASLLSMTGD